MVGYAVTHPSWGHRLVGVEGLRAFAAVVVVIGHVDVKLAPGAIGGFSGRLLGLTGQGLTLFFALSGFLLFRPFAMSLITGAALPSIRHYALNRSLRIFPVYIVILCLVSFVLGVANTHAPTWGDTNFDRTDNSIGFLTDPVKFIASLFMVQTFFPYTTRSGLGVAWSLSVELVFYIALPLLALLAMRVGAKSRRRVAAIALPTATLLVLGCIGKFWSWWTFHNASPADQFALDWGDNWTSVANRSIFVHADLFAYGMIAATVLALVQARKLNSRQIQLARLTSLLVFIVGILGGVDSIGGAVFRDSVFGAAFGALLLLVCLPTQAGHHSALSRFLDFAPFRYLGLVSFSVYLWHVPVIWLLFGSGWVFPSSPVGLLANTILVLTITVAISSVTYWLVEAQAMRFKKRTGAKNGDYAPSAPVPATVPH